MRTAAQAGDFYGWTVARAAFVLGFFGWGMGFYGPPVFLGTIVVSTGWPVMLVSTAVTVHFLIGAIVGANLPALHDRLTTANATKVGALAMLAGVIAWATATAPWHLFLAAGLSGWGWGSMSAASLNVIVSPWFAHGRPAALATAYNGGSVGGIVFSPLWVAAIALLGFPLAAATLGAAMAVAIWILSDRVFSHTPASMGVACDGNGSGRTTQPPKTRTVGALPGLRLWRDRKFATLSAGMTLGLFAQIGLTAHLYSLLVPALGAQHAGFAMALITVMAIVGRTLLGRLLRPGTDRRLIACLGYAAQLAGSIAFVLAAGVHIPLLLLGVLLFGTGFGNATSLPPLIAQVEFAEEDVPRAISLIVGIAQGGYAFAPALFGIIRALDQDPASGVTGGAGWIFLAAALVQSLAIAAFLAGRGR